MACANMSSGRSTSSIFDSAALDLGSCACCLMEAGGEVEREGQLT